MGGLLERGYFGYLIPGTASKHAAEHNGRSCGTKYYDPVRNFKWVF